MDKRTFLKTGVLGSLATSISSFDYNKEDKTTIVFQGDSITDVGRDKAQYYANNAAGLGTGYVHMVGASLLEQYPDRHLKIYNRGVSGHKVFQLAARWEDDALLLKPDILSILIGVNDFWHTLTSNYIGTVTVYENDLRSLLQKTKEALPQVKIILGEPFAVKGGIGLIKIGTDFPDPKWVSEFPAYQAACRKVAKEFNAQWIPYQSIFDGVLNNGGAAYWCPDGVHPSLAGGRLMANAWIKVYQQI